MVLPDPEHSASKAPHRKIIHIDMDAFYASVEQRDNPDLRGQPVAVGGSAERGVVAAASYEARQYGVRSAMPSVTAKRQCPDLIFVKPRFEVYKAVSRQIREIFAEHTPIIEPLSLDEAYLDVTENLQGILLARDIALRIREKIKAETGLNASAGISYNKFLAKLASDHRKPNGQYVISPETGRPSSRRCRSGSFTASGRQPPPNSTPSGFGPASTSATSPSRSCRRTSASPAPTTTGFRAASTSALYGPIVSANRSAPRTRSSQISRNSTQWSPSSSR
jgi:DNA polymerase IV